MSGFANILGGFKPQPKPAPQPAAGPMAGLPGTQMPAPQRTNPGLPTIGGAPNIDPVAAGPPPVLTEAPAPGGLATAPPNAAGTITADNVAGSGAGPASLGGQGAYGGTVTVGQIDPKTGLRGQTVLPGQGVDRMALMNQALSDYDTGAQPQLNATMRHATQLAAANGRMGSGMLTTDYGNAVSDYQRNRQLFGNDLLRSATEGSIGDARNTRDELRTERGYQDDLAKSALDQKYRQQVLGDSEMGQKFNQDLARSNLQMQGGQFTAGQGASLGDALGQLMNFHRISQATKVAK